MRIIARRPANASPGFSPDSGAARKWLWRSGDLWASMEQNENEPPSSSAPRRPRSRASTVKNPVCPVCGHRFPWKDALGQVSRPRTGGSALWGVGCPSCRADLKVPNGHALLIAASGIFFGSQSSILLLVGRPDRLTFLLGAVLLVAFFYALAIFLFFDLEQVS